MGWGGWAHQAQGCLAHSWRAPEPRSAPREAAVPPSRPAAAKAADPKADPRRAPPCRFVTVLADGKERLFVKDTEPGGAAHRCGGLPPGCRVTAVCGAVTTSATRAAELLGELAVVCTTTMHDYARICTNMHEHARVCSRACSRGCSASGAICGRMHVRVYVCVHVSPRPPPLPSPDLHPRPSPGGDGHLRGRPHRVVRRCCPLVAASCQNSSAAARARAEAGHSYRSEAVLPQEDAGGQPRL